MGLGVLTKYSRQWRPSMIPIKGYSTFDKLKHCIVGRGQDPKLVEGELQEVMQTTEEDLKNLINVLESKGVTVHRPSAETSTTRPPISPRDYFIAIGENLLVGKLVEGYKDILKNIDPKIIKWFLDTDISSGNMIRCGDHIHWDISKDVKRETEKRIIVWLHDENKYKVSITRYGWHMDGLYSIVKPGAIVAVKELPELEKIYPGWDICYLDQQPIQKPIQHEWGGNYQESNYDVNLLSIDQEHCIVPSKNKPLLNFLEKHKINPIITPFRNKAFWDNGIHCVTQDLYREGDKHDYVGKQ